MKSLFKVFAATTIIMVTAFSFISCNQDNGYISLNSAVFFLVRKFYMLRCLLGFYMLI